MCRDKILGPCIPSSAYLKLLCLFVFIIGDLVFPRFVTFSDHLPFSQEIALRLVLTFWPDPIIPLWYTFLQIRQNVQGQFIAPCLPISPRLPDSSFGAHLGTQMLLTQFDSHCSLALFIKRRGLTDTDMQTYIANHVSKLIATIQTNTKLYFILIFFFFLFCL